MYNVWASGSPPRRIIRTRVTTHQHSPTPKGERQHRRENQRRQPDHEKPVRAEAFAVEAQPGEGGDDVMVAEQPQTDEQDRQEERRLADRGEPRKKRDRRDPDDECEVELARPQPARRDRPDDAAAVMAPAPRIGREPPAGERRPGPPGARFGVYAFRPCAAPGAGRPHPSRRTRITASSS